MIERGMASKERKQEKSLLQRWKKIEALEDSEDEASEAEFTRLKEAWFLDAFTFLFGLPKNEHCWCGSKDIMWPLLEPFCHYFEDSGENSSLHVLWKRLSNELSSCIQCVLQHHKAKSYYATEYVEDIVRPLLSVLQVLDEERVAMHIKDIMQKIESNKIEADKDSEAIVCVLFEVLMFPSLLEDAEVNDLFIPFLKHVEATHELTLAGNQHYPGVYALLFHPDQGTRGIALRLVSTVGKLRNLADLDSIQPTLQNFMHMLEFDIYDPKDWRLRADKSTKNSTACPTISGKRSRRACLTRESLWIGMKALLGMLEPAVFEGIADRYPSFISIVLNHVSEATPVFWNALHCLRMLLDALGFKLWLKTTFSPGVMRNTFLGQCFHTCEERIHKAIFDLFQPFLQSLEALQDGEYERQRRNILYFLLQQVPYSSNFSGLMNKKARQIAFLIVERGYKMTPSCPPVECAHVWAPPLVESVKDTSLYTSIRQPAIVLMQAIVIADTVGLTYLYTKKYVDDSFDDILELYEQDFEEFLEAEPVQVAEDSCWNDVKRFDKSSSSEWCQWRCIPLLWLDILEGVNPSCLPASFSQAVLWARSQLSVVFLRSELKSSGVCAEMTSSTDIAIALQWEKPKGCDDGAGGKYSLNSVDAQFSHMQLLTLLRRSTDCYVTQLRECGIVEQWLWDPVVAEVLTLLFLEPDERLRDFNRNILSHFANDRGLDAGLEFLCSGQAFPASVSSGFKHAIKALLVTDLPDSNQGLQNLFFISWKILSLGWKSSESKIVSQNPSKLFPSAEAGGFLKQVDYSNSTGCATFKDRTKEMTKAAARLCHQLSSYLWPLLMKILKKGCQFADDNMHLMTFARMFDLLPLVFRSIVQISSKRVLHKLMHKGCTSSKNSSSFFWLQEFIGWGRVEAMVIRRRWKSALMSIMRDISESTSQLDPEMIREAIKLLQTGLNLQQLSECGDLEKDNEEKENVIGTKITTVCTEGHDALKATKPVWESDIIDLSDDETDDEKSKDEHLKPEASKVKLSQTLITDEKSLEDIQLNNTENEFNRMAINHSWPANSPIEALEVSHGFSSKHPKMHKRPISMPRSTCSLSNTDRKITLDKYYNSMKNEPLKPADLAEVMVKDVRDTTDDGKNIHHLPIGDAHASGSLQTPQLVDSEDFGRFTVDRGSLETPQSGEADDVKQYTADRGLGSSQVRDKATSDLRQGVARKHPETIVANFIDPERKENLSTSLSKTKMDSILRELVSDSVEDPLDSALNAAVQRAPISKTPVHYPKRQLIRLQLPNEQARGKIQGAAVRAPPRLDEWYKNILSMNYFYVIGIDTNASPEDVPDEPLAERPLVFQSVEHYVDVFRRFVLEEFKAQIQRAHEDILMSEGPVTGVLKMMSLEKVDMFQLCRFTAEPGKDAVAKTCFENDLLLLSRQPFQNASQSVHVIAKVERRERDAKSKSVILILKLFLHLNNSRLAKARRFMIDRSEWHAVKVMNITPQLREFQALSSVANNVFLPIILNPGKCKVQTTKPSFESISKSLQSQLQSDYNECQLKTIADVAKAGSGVCQCLSLVQGPPGTGKTRTIIAIVSILLAIARSSVASTYQHEDSFQKMVNFRTSSVTRTPLDESVAISKSWQDAALARELIKEDSSSLKRGQAEKIRRGRVLVCAQSNAAVDELVSRMIEGGLYDSYGHIFKPFLVRVGNVKTVHPNSLGVFIDTLVDERIAADGLSADVEREETSKRAADELRSKLENVIEKIRLVETQRSQFLIDNVTREGENLVDKRHELPMFEQDSSFQSREENVREPPVQSESVLKAKLNFLYRQRRQLCSELAFAESKERKITEESRIKRQMIRKEIIKQAEVVVTTLSGCGGDIYSTCMESNTRQNGKKYFEDVLFDAVVIDEAAQALEPATLIPLQLLRPDFAKCVMVGDPKQLPATVLSQLSGMSLYECSMFERLQLGGYPVTLLSTQYRMHPEICKFPSAHFYQNQLINGENLTKGGRVAAFHKDQHFGPYMFFDVVEGYEQVSTNSLSQSLCNEAEVEVAFEIFKSLEKRYPSETLSRRFGVITPYKQQLSKLRRRFIHSFGGQVSSSEIEFNTVDGFQGREVDILILSTVRASSKKANNSQLGGIGFVADVRRMNVALTRARFSLWIVGNANTLKGNPSWAALIDDAKTRGVFHTVRKPYNSFFLNHSSSDGRLINVHSPRTNSIGQAVANHRERSALRRSPGNITDPDIKPTSLPSGDTKQHLPPCSFDTKDLDAKKRKIQNMGAEASLREDARNKKNKTAAAATKTIPSFTDVLTGADQDRKEVVHTFMGRTKNVEEGTTISHNVARKPSKIGDPVHKNKSNATASSPTSRTRLRSSTESVETVAKKHRLPQVEHASQLISESLLGRKDKTAETDIIQEKKEKMRQERTCYIQPLSNDVGKTVKKTPPPSKNKESSTYGDEKTSGKAEESSRENNKALQQLKSKTDMCRSIKENLIPMSVSESVVTNLVSISQSMITSSSADLSTQTSQDEKQQNPQTRDVNSSNKDHQYAVECNQKGLSEVKKLVMADTSSLDLGACHQQESFNGKDLHDDFKDLNNEWEQFEKVLAELKNPIQPHG